MDEAPVNLAQAVADQLRERKVKLVLAESCTGGLAAATLVEVAGISQNFCGSLVTYRDETKADWLGVSRPVLQNPKLGAVSPIAAEEMCLGALERTKEADLAASITGHLGPDAPDDLDGTLFIGIVWRGGVSPLIQRRTLTESSRATTAQRRARQEQAVEFLLDAVQRALASRPA